MVHAHALLCGRCKCERVLRINLVLNKISLPLVYARTVSICGRRMWQERPIFLRAHFRRPVQPRLETPGEPDGRGNRSNMQGRHLQCEACELFTTNVAVEEY